MKQVFRPGEVAEAGKPLVVPARAGAAPTTPEAEAERLRRLRKQAGEQARGLVARAEAEAARIVEEARREAETIRRLAAEDAAARTAAAQNEADAVLRAAREKGFEEGYAAGLAEAREAAREILTRLERFVEKAKAVRREVLEAAAEGGVDVVLAALRTLLLREVEADRDLAARLLREAAREISATERVVLRIAEADLDAAPGLAEIVRAEVEGLRSVEVVPDPLVQPGGLVIETDFGRVDAQIETRLAELERALRRTRVAPPDDLAPGSAPETNA